MKKGLKRVLAAMLTLLMVIGGLSMIPDTNAKADDGTFQKVTYNFECTDFVGEDTVKFTATAGSWGSANASYEVKEAGKFSLTLDFGKAETAFINLGYFETSESTKDNVYTLSSMMINDVEFAISASLYANKEGTNGLPNIWSGKSDTDVLAEAKDGSKIYGGSDTLKITWHQQNPENPSDPVDGYKAELTYTANGYWPQLSDSVVIDGDGTYSILLDSEDANFCPAKGAICFYIDIKDAYKALAGCELKDLSIELDGEKFDCDFSKVLWGNLEDNTNNYRIEIYNEYGKTKNDSPIDIDKLTFEKSMKVTFTLEEKVVDEPGEGTEGTEGTEKPEEPKEFNPDVNVPTSVSGKSEASDAVTSKPYTAQIMYFSKGYHYKDNESTTTVTGDGTYTITINAKYAASGVTVLCIDLLDAYGEMGGYKLMDLSIKCDGVNVPVDLSKVLVGDLENKGNYRIDLYNEYGDTKKDSGIDTSKIVFEKTMTVTFTLDADGKPNEAGEQAAQITKKNEISAADMTALVNSNKTSPIAIQNDKNVFFVFDAGTMALVDGITNYDFGSTFDNDYSKLTNAPFAQDKFIVRINYNYDGKLPATAKVMIPVGKELKGTRLYYYEVKDDGTYKYTSQGVVDENGYLTLTQSHCSDYVITTYADAEAIKDMGDNTMLICLVLVAGAALVGVGLYSKKRLFAK